MSFFRKLFDKLKSGFDRNRNVDFKPFYRLSLIPRGQPAKLSSQSKADLLSKDYVQIGIIEVKHRTSIGWDDGHNKVFPEKMDLKSDLLSEAAKRGGDIVTLTHDTVSVTKGISRQGRCLRWEKRQVPSQRPVYETYTDGYGVHTRQTGYETCYVWENYCAEWEYISGREYSILCEGIVWRKDPQLAGKTPLHEM